MSSFQVRVKVIELGLEVKGRVSVKFRSRVLHVSGPVHVGITVAITMTVARVRCG